MCLLCHAYQEWLQSNMPVTRPCRRVVPGVTALRLLTGPGPLVQTPESINDLGLGLQKKHLQLCWGEPLIPRLLKTAQWVAGVMN